MKNIDEHRQDAKWLDSTLNELVLTSDVEEAERERGHLQEVLDKYQRLLPAVEITTTKSQVVLRCLEYRETVEQSAQWLQDTNATLTDSPPLDDLQAVKVMLDQQEVSQIGLSILSQGKKHLILYKIPLRYLV